MTRVKRNLVEGLLVALVVGLLVAMAVWRLLLGVLLGALLGALLGLILGVELVRWALVRRQESQEWLEWLEPLRELYWLEPKLTQIKDLLTFKTKSKGEDWAKSLGWFIPRKYRHVIGDILEDCAEMREAGCKERRIKFHVVYQWLIAVITLVPTAVKSSIVDAVRQVISRPK